MREALRTAPAVPSPHALMLERLCLIPRSAGGAAHEGGAAHGHDGQQGGQPLLPGERSSLSLWNFGAGRLGAQWVCEQAGGLFMPALSGRAGGRDYVQVPCPCRAGVQHIACVWRVPDTPAALVTNHAVLCRAALCRRRRFGWPTSRTRPRAAVSVPRMFVACSWCMLPPRLW